MINRTVNILLICTSGCNLACTYCYCDKGQTQSMGIGAFKEAFNKLDAYFDDTTEFHIVFHGGEPLILGAQFYRDALAFLGDQRRPLHTSIQTNLTLMNDEFISLFKANGCTVSTSVDGSRSMHDANRRYPDGKGSYEDVVRKVALLDECEVPFGGVIVTLNESNTVNARELYDSLRRFEAHAIGFSIVYRADGKDDVVLDPAHLGAFLIEIFDLWSVDEEPLRLSFFESIVRSALGINPYPECTFCNRCADGFIAIDASGEVYPCGDFVGKRSYLYGNILTQDFKELWEGPARNALAHRQGAEGTAATCQGCAYDEICRSGCPAKSPNGYADKDVYCEAYKMLFAHLKRSIEHFGDRGTETKLKPP
ncbi:MAG: SPASM domain-containing protein [Coriobacteriales bacterium]|nr:SPASM domain-containing protein [Coriobacteriales bacterium]